MMKTAERLARMIAGFLVGLVMGLLLAIMVPILWAKESWSSEDWPGIGDGLLG